MSGTGRGGFMIFKFFRAVRGMNAAKLGENTNNPVYRIAVNRFLNLHLGAEAAVRMRKRYEKAAHPIGRTAFVFSLHDR